MVTAREGRPASQEQPLVGHGYERAGVCSACGGQLQGAGGEYHTTAYGDAICCRCAGRDCRRRRRTA